MDAELSRVRRPGSARACYGKLKADCHLPDPAGSSHSLGDSAIKADRVEVVLSEVDQRRSGHTSCPCSVSALLPAPLVDGIILVLSSDVLIPDRMRTPISRAGILPGSFGTAPFRANSPPRPSRERRSWAQEFRRSLFSPGKALSRMHVHREFGGCISVAGAAFGNSESLRSSSLIFACGLPRWWLALAFSLVPSMATLPSLTSPARRHSSSASTKSLASEHFRVISRGAEAVLAPVGFQNRIEIPFADDLGDEGAQVILRQPAVQGRRRQERRIERRGSTSVHPAIG